MRYLITGATGFIGSHLCDLLISQSHEVTGVTRTSTRPGLPENRADLVSWEDLEDFLRKTGPPDYVIHVAGATRAFDYAGYLSGNVEPTRRLLEMLVRTGFDKGSGRFALISSQAAAGPSRDGVTPVLESDAPSPVSLYGKSKLEAEKVVLSFSHRLPVTIARPPTVFGPRDKDTLGVFRSAKMGVAAYIRGASELVSVVYAPDLVRGIAAAVESDRAIGQIFFLANQEPVRWKDFCRLAGRAVERTCLPLPVPLHVARLLGRFGDLMGRITGTPALLRSDKLEDMKQRGWVCSAEKARRVLGWKATTPLAAALAETARWYKERGWV
jgi:nucleoside-diphosphate-sugar epimerase